MNDALGNASSKTTVGGPASGADHQAAQEGCRAKVCGASDEQDCTGQGRLLRFDRNWEVVSIDPRAGTPLSEDTTITLCAEKQGE